MPPAGLPAVAAGHPRCAVDRQLVLPPRAFVMGLLRHPAGPRRPHQRPAPAADLRRCDEPHRHVEHDMAEIVADPVHQLAMRGAAARQPREIAVGSVEHMPAHVQQQPERHAPGPGKLAIGRRRQHDRQCSCGRDHVGRDARGYERAGQPPRQRMIEARVEPVLQLRRAGRTLGLGGRGGGLVHASPDEGEGGVALAWCVPAYRRVICAAIPHRYGDA